MSKGCFYDLLTQIKDDSKLANVFNNILASLNTIRIFSAPKTFDAMNDSEGRYGIDLFYESCLWEMYLHNVVSRLKKWEEILNEYFVEFDGNWKYYASSKRIESLNEYGGEDEDYNDDGSIKIMNVPNQMLEHYTVIRDLVREDWIDIVQETTAENLKHLCVCLQTNASLSIPDIFKQSMNVDIPTYKQDVSGNMVQMGFADKVLMKLFNQDRSEGLSAIIIVVCNCVQFLIKEIRNLDKFEDNKMELLSIHKDIRCLFDLDFNKINVLKNYSYE